MNTPSPIPGRPEPLTPQERALAASLLRIGPHGDPSPQLDAAIIGAAHAASSRQPRLRHRRWPALLGIAATLALAVGVTWRMPPVAESPLARDEIPRETARTTASTPPADATSAAVAEQAVMPAAEPDRSREDSARQRMHAPAAAEKQTPQAAAVPARETPTATASTASLPPAAAPPAPPAPPPPPPPAMPTTQAADAAVIPPAEPDAMSRRLRDSHVESSAARSSTSTQAPATATAPAAFPFVIGQLPVASDRDLAQPAWLDRIRLRRDGGDVAGARESLRMLRVAHPDLVLPDDLRGLAAGQP